MKTQRSQKEINKQGVMKAHTELMPIEDGSIQSAI